MTINVNFMNKLLETVLKKNLYKIRFIKYLI